MSQDPNATAGGQDGSQEFDESKFPKFENIDPETITPEQVVELKKAGQTLLGLTKHYRDKSGKLETEIKQKGSQKPPEPPPTPSPGAGDDDVKERVQRLETSEEKRQFGHAHSLSPEEADSLFGFAKGMGLKPSEALNHPFFKAGLDATRQQSNAANAIPGPSGRAPIVEGKTFGDMTPDERKKNFSKVVGATQRK